MLNSQHVSDSKLRKRNRSEPPAESLFSRVIMATPPLAAADPFVRPGHRSDSSLALLAHSPTGLRLEVGSPGTQVLGNPQSATPQDAPRINPSSDTCTASSEQRIPPPWPRSQSDAGSSRHTCAAPSGSGRMDRADDAILLARDGKGGAQTQRVFRWCHDASGSPLTQSSGGMPERSLKKSVTPSATRTEDRSSQALSLSALQFQALLPVSLATAAGSSLGSGSLLGQGAHGLPGYTPGKINSGGVFGCETGACTASIGDLAHSLMSYLPGVLPSRQQQQRRYLRGSSERLSALRAGCGGGRRRASLNAMAAAAAAEAASAASSAAGTAATAASAAAVAAGAAAASASAAASAASAYAGMAATAAASSAECSRIAIRSPLMPSSAATQSTAAADLYKAPGGLIASHCILNSTSASSYSQAASCAALPVAQSVALLMDVLHPTVAPITRDSCLSLAALPDCTREDLLRHKCRRTGKGRSLLERVEAAVSLVSATSSLQALEMPL